MKNNIWKLQQNKTITEAHLGGKSFIYNLICMGADQQARLMRADLTGLTYTYAQPSYKKQKPSFASMDRIYGDALCSRDCEDVLLQLWQGGHTRVGILPSP
jgi:hypothetical protein